MSARPTLSVKRTPALQPPANPDVQLLGARLRCRRCDSEWAAALDEFLRVLPEHMACPRCARLSPPPAAA